MPLHKRAKSLLNKSKRRDPWFLDDYTLNPFSGCSFNCLYCYIRGSKYGEHMEEKLAIKDNAAELLEKELARRAKKKQYGVVVLSSATDPYLQFEGESKITRRLLEILAHYRFPVHVITKSDKVVRDFDVLKEIDRNAILPSELQPRLKNRAFITFSFSTMDDAVSKQFEPGATPPSMRLAALKKTLDAGFHSGVSLMPLLPLISDTQEKLDEMTNTIKMAGAHYAFLASITLFGYGASDSRTLVFRAIREHYPHLLPNYEKVFAKGFSTDPEYQSSLKLRISKSLQRFPIPQSILQL